MPRLSRSQLATFTYFHICSKGNGGQEIFYDDKDCFRYLCLIEKYRTKYNLRCFSYCLMPNHVHLLLLTPSIITLSKAIHAIHVSYVMYFNRRYERNGHLLQDRFASQVITDEKHLLSAKEYIENNPVKSGIVESKEDYRWSSARRDGSPVTIYPLMT